MTPPSDAFVFWVKQPGRAGNARLPATLRFRDGARRIDGAAQGAIPFFCLALTTHGPSSNKMK